LTIQTPINPTQQRRTIRVRDYDYTQAGAYFITICTRNRECLWGKVVNGMVQLSETGRLVESVWLQTATVRPDIELDAYVVMPNHFHSIFFIHESPGVPGATRRVAPTKNHSAVAGKTHRPTGPKPRSVGAVMAQFKSLVTKRINDTRQYRGIPVWQRNYYEHVIRDEESLNRIREYIATNAQRWDSDRENLQATEKDAFDDWLATFKSSPGN
jgi:REP element-mobilizing transposase RayT